MTVYDLIQERLEQAEDMRDHTAFKACKKAAIEWAAMLICIRESTREGLVKYHAVNPGIERVVH